MKLILTILVLITLNSCNRSLADFEDNIISISNLGIIFDSPKYIEDQMILSGKVDLYTLLYNDNMTLSSIYKDSSKVAQINYLSDSVQIIRGTDTTIGNLDSGRIVEAITYRNLQAPIITKYFYDNEGYLIKELRNNDSVLYFYSNGNLVIRENYSSFITTDYYEYYDSLHFRPNSFEHANNAVDIHQDYLNLYGKHNSNLLKSVKYGINNSSFFYTWEIENFRIRKLSIFNSLGWLVEIKYYKGYLNE